MLKKIEKVISYFFKQIKFLFKFKEVYKSHNTINQILMLGGYGYGNTGDEAQCSQALRILHERYPLMNIKVLTPDPNYTMEQHKCCCEYASRVAFFNQGYCNSSFFNNEYSFFDLILFVFNAIIIIFNAYLVRADLPVLFLNARAAKLLQTIKESKLIYFAGGGYLTGETLSRLWDGVVVCKAADILCTPVVMSGQTIGIWKNSFNKMIAKWGFKNVKLITVRDEKFSLADLKDIGFQGSNYFATHDDALFCAKAEGKLIESDNYITMNFHYWGMKDKQKQIYINKLHDIVEEILSKTDNKIVFIPMHASDKASFDDYINKYPNQRMICFDYDYDFRKVRNVIANSKFCITMKHHPIIFAMGENVPVISLAFSQYYVHKNIGALQQYGQEKFSINLEDDDYLNKFEVLFDELIKNQLELKNCIKERLKILNKRKEKFLNMVDEILIG